MRNTIAKKSSGPLTKEYLDVSMSTMKQYIDKRLSNSDKQWEKRLNQTLNLIFEKNTRAIMKYIDFKIEPLEEMRKDYYQFKDSVLKSLDWLMSAYKKFDEEHTVLSESYSYVREKVDNHETRISNLEDKKAS